MPVGTLIVFFRNLSKLWHCLKTRCAWRALVCSLPIQRWVSIIFIFFIRVKKSLIHLFLPSKEQRGGCEAFSHGWWGPRLYIATICSASQMSLLMSCPFISVSMYPDSIVFAFVSMIIVTKFKCKFLNGNANWLVEDFVTLVCQMLLYITLILNKNIARITNAVQCHS